MSDRELSAEYEAVLLSDDRAVEHGQFIFDDWSKMSLKPNLKEEHDFVLVGQSVW
jgi:hypothetical protein